MWMVRADGPGRWAVLLVVASVCGACSAIARTPVGSPLPVPSSPAPHPPTTTTPPEATVELPDVTGLRIAAARTLLEELGLGADVSRVFSGRPEGTVLHQRPVAGEEVREGDTVSLFVAKPYPPMPDVVGQDLEGARTTLEGLGVDVRIEVVRQISSAREDTVLAQDPAPGTRLTPGARVTLTVAKRGRRGRG
ncbi:MAG: PASTA domain-containing protein [Actinobacteria bacterium]|nr:PASTA domain-containing protein [Actinomycetota bacterium]